MSARSLSHIRSCTYAYQAAKFQRSKMCSITGAAEKVTEPVETHTCSSIVLNAIHETSAAITAEELLQVCSQGRVRGGVGCLSFARQQWFTCTRNGGRRG